VSLQLMATVQAVIQLLLLLLRCMLGTSSQPKHAQACSKGRTACLPAELLLLLLLLLLCGVVIISDHLLLCFLLQIPAGSQLIVVVMLLLLLLLQLPPLLLGLPVIPCRVTTVAHLEGAADNLHLVVLPDRHCTNLQGANNHQPAALLQ
jgi:hypothetical protein